MNLQELKNKKPDELVAMAEQLGIEEASSKRFQELIYEILQKLVENNEIIEADGVLQILTDGFGFLRSPKYNYLPGPDDIYVPPSMIKRYGLRTGQTISGEIRSPKEGERYFALQKITSVFESEDIEKTTALAAPLNGA